MFLERHLSIPLRRTVQGLEPVIVEGPRGAGKTTLLRREYPEHLYINLEEAGDRQRARQDPDAFIKRLRRAAVLDEVQRAPELVAFLRESTLTLPLILASSVRLHLPIQRLELHRPTLAERHRRKALPIETIGRFTPALTSRRAESESWDEHRSWPEEDLRWVECVRDVDLLLRFAELARANSGQGLHLQELARQTGVSHRTAVRWMEALEACFLVLRLEAIEVDFGRRVLKRPKLHFLAGSNCFESEVVSEIYRNAVHTGSQPRIGYWRDSNGLEIPLVIEHEEDGDHVGVGIAEAATPAIEGSLQRWMRLAQKEKAAMITKSLPQITRRETRILRYEACQL